MSGICAGRELPLPQVPSELTVPADRAAYVMLHFWDAMEWDDTTALRDTAFVEQTFVNFLSIAPHAPQKAAEKALKSLVGNFAADVASLRMLSDLSERYLGEQESPVFNEACHEIMCRELMARFPDGSAEQQYFSYQAQRLAKNRPGSEPADFRFLDRYGRSTTLKASIKTGSETLLMFFDPDCQDCHLLAKRIAADRELQGKIDRGEIQVIAITPVATDPELWKSYADTLPEEWTVGYSPEGEIEERELYDIPTIPCIYLLDANGKVAERCSRRYQ